MSDANARPTKTVDLPMAIKRGETEIASLVLRKPHAGELRGVTLSNLLSSDIGSILTVLPRISEPPLTEHEAKMLEPENLVVVAGEIVGFFLTETERAALELQATPQISIN